MADSSHFGQLLDSDHVPENFCEPCYEVNDAIKPVAGFCQNCHENLCIKCYSEHLRRKLFKDHKLVDKSTRPKTKSTSQTNLQSPGLECHLHHGETIHLFCHGHSQLCCKVCLTVNHQACNTETISKLARNVQDSEEIQNLIKKLNEVKKGFNDNLSKIGANGTVIQRNHSDAINEIKKLREEFEQLMTKTELKAEEVKEEDIDKLKNVASICDIVIEQIDKMSTNLNTLKKNGEAESLFVAMKRAESQISSLEENLKQTDKDNTVEEYKFVPDARLKTLFNNLEELGQLLLQKSVSAEDSQSPQLISPSHQQEKKPTHLKDISVKSSSDKDFDLYGSLVLPNKQILITDSFNNKLKLIDSNEGTIISELQLADRPFNITKVNDKEVAVSVPGIPKSKIQFVSVSQNTLSKVREISVNNTCRGIVYNTKDNTLIVAYILPAKVEILNMEGSVIKCLDKDSSGAKFFSNPLKVTLSPDMTNMYVIDSCKHSVTMMTMNGDVKAVYEDKGLLDPRGICVHKSGIVYVVGYDSKTVHLLNPDSGKFKFLLDQKDGLKLPISISYCDLEDKMYIGMERSSILKVFQMK